MLGFIHLSILGFVFSAGPIMALGPRWLCKIYAATFVVAAASIAAAVSRSPMDSAGAVFGLAILWLAALATLGGIVLGLLIRWIRHPRRPNASPAPSEPHAPLFSQFEIAALGVMVTYLGGLMLLSPLQGRPDLLRSLMLAAMLLVVGGSALRVIARWYPTLNWVLPKTFATVAIAIGAASLTAGAGGALYTQRIIASAEAAAGGRPYCIEVAGKRGHDRAARSLWDLHPFVMTAEWTGFFYLQRHAQLVVTASSTTLVKPAHWSYRAGSFVPSQTDTTSAFCAPRRHFAANLSWHDSGAPDEWRAAGAGMVVRAPAMFAPAIVEGWSSPSPIRLICCPAGKRCRAGWQE